MTRHPRSNYYFTPPTKENKVISTAHTAKSASTPKAGRFALLRGPHRAPGSGAPERGPIAAPFVARFLVALCALAGLFALSTAAVAQAEPPKLVSNGYFRAPAADGIAVDQSSEDLFVSGLLSEFGFGSIEKFNASDELLSPPSPFAEASLSGLHYGVAVNPRNGDLYVASAASSSGSIEVFNPNTGELLSSFSVPPFSTEAEGVFGRLFNGVQIATDAAGNVYVPNVPESKVFEYNEKGELQNEFTGSGAHAVMRPTGVAVDSSGNVWIADNFHNRIEKLSPTGAFLSEFESEGVRALALDGHGDVLAIVKNGADFCGSIDPPCEHFVEYSSNGAQLFDAGAGNFGQLASEFPLPESFVAVNEASGRVYVTDGFKDRVWVFQPPEAPTIGQESAAEVGTSDAKLGALVNPGGAQASYRFEYDTRPYAAGEGAHGTSVPFPEGVAGEGISMRALWAAAKGLEPGTTYHYRAIVTNGVGTVVGPDQTFTTATSAQVACPNEDARGGPSALLPDCRAYELVTQAGKTGAQPAHDNPVRTGTNTFVVANDGDRYTYNSREVMPGSQSAGLDFISTRGPEGWSTQDALPLQPYTGDRCTTFEDGAVRANSADLAKAVILVNNYQEPPGGLGPVSCHGEAVEVVPGEPLGVENLLLDDYETGSYRLINVTPPGVMPTPPKFEAASADLKLVLFSERAKLTPEAQNNTVNLYEWHDGTVSLCKLFLPSGAPVAGEVVSVSPNGSEIFFKAGGRLYVRVNDERTVQIDGARGGSGPGGGGSYAGLSADESQVFFSDEASAGLTSDTAPGSGSNLYRYDIDTGQLSDLTPVAGADATFSGVGEDGSYLYFTSPTAVTGSQANQSGETAQSGQENLYLDHEGTIAFVTHAGAFTDSNGIKHVPVVSANGAFLAFTSTDSQAGYDNNGQPEIYLYSAQANRFECASCNPDGEAPSSGVSLGNAPGLNHWVTNHGQVLFETAEALLPRDTDGVSDVYEFDFDSGLHLISSGTSAYDSRLLPASVSGNDVFFLTRQQLVPQDGSQEALKVDDARVDGGFPVAAAPPLCTTADACRSAASPQPSIYGAPSSQTFSGAGNLAPASEAKPKAKSRSKPVKCKRGFVKKKGKCVKKSAKKARRSAHANKKGK